MNHRNEKVVLLAHLDSRFAENMAIHLLQAGHTVLISSRDFPSFKGIPAGHRLHCLPFDLSVAEDVKLAREHVLEHWHGLDALVTSFHSEASAAFPLTLSDMDWNQILNAEAKCQFLIARSFIPLLALRKDSLFVTIGDSSFDNPLVQQGLEGLSFSFQMMLIKKMAYETRGNTTVHSLFLNETGTSLDALTSENVADALVTLIDNIEWNKGNAEFRLNWRDRMVPLDEDVCVSGI